MKVPLPIRTVTVAALATAAVVGATLSAAPSAAVDTNAPVAIEQVAFAGGLPSLQLHWWGAEIRFNKVQTKALLAMNIATAVAMIAGKNPEVGVGTGVASEGIKEVVSAAVDNGNCVRMVRTWYPGSMWMGAPYKC